MIDKIEYCLARRPCAGCPYRGSECIKKILTDVKAYMLQQEKRIEALTDMINTINEELEAYEKEAYDRDKVIASFVEIGSSRFAVGSGEYATTATGSYVDFGGITSSSSTALSEEDLEALKISSWTKATKADSWKF